MSPIRRMISRRFRLIVFCFFVLCLTAIYALLSKPYLLARLRTVPLAAIEWETAPPVGDHSDWLIEQLEKGVSVSLPRRFTEGRNNPKGFSFQYRDSENSTALYFHPSHDSVKHFPSLLQEFRIDPFPNEFWASQFDIDREALTMTTAEIAWSASKDDASRILFLASWRQNIFGQSQESLSWFKGRAAPNGETQCIVSMGENEHTRWMLARRKVYPSCLSVYDRERRGVLNILFTKTPVVTAESAAFLHDLANTVRFSKEILPME